ncbi:efflux RND transporter permease subunit [bacterium]|nr:efflux RND transporter permease subunit [bacterium]
MFLADISIKRPVLMTMVIMAFVVIGLFSFMRLGIDLMPEIDFPFVTVVTVYPGAGPEEIESLINEPMEEEVGSISGVKTVYSMAMEGVSMIFIELKLGENVDIRAIDVKDKIDAIRSNLPADIENPIVQKFEAGSEPIMNLTVTGPYTLPELYDRVDRLIKPELGKISGLASIDIVGEQEREIKIELSASKMKSYGISPLQVVMALGSENWNLPAGRIEKGRKEYTLRLSGEYESIPDLKATRIQTPSGPIRLDRVARVRDSFAEMREMARFDGQPTIGMDIIKRTDANTVQVAKDVFNLIEKLEKRLPEGMHLEVARDNSQFIENSVADTRSNLIMGILFTAIILFLFLHSWRGTVIAALSMPISIIATFILVDAAGFTLNMMTLTALAISVGILVVNAIVVLENIERLHSEGMDIKTAASKGTGEIAIAVAAATLTNIVVFTPMAFMQGIIGLFFKPFGLTVAFATIFSLLISFTLTPMMASRPLRGIVYVMVGLITFFATWLYIGTITAIILVAIVLFLVIAERLGLVARFGRFWDKWYEELANDYRVGLNWAIKHRFILMGSVTLLFMVGVFLFSFVGAEFFTKYDERMMSVNVEMPAGSRIEETNRVLYNVEEVLAEYKEVETVYTSVGKGSSGDMGGSQGVQYGSIIVKLRPRAEGNFPPTADVVKEVRTKLADIPAAEIVVAEATQFGGGGAQADIQLELQGQNFDSLLVAADRAVELIQATGKAVDVSSDWEVGKPEVVIRPDRIRLSDVGASVQDIALILRTLFEGTVATQYREEGEEYDVRVRLVEEDRNKVDQVGDLILPLPSGYVPLKDVAQVEFGSGPTQVSRKNKQRIITISANVATGTMGELQTTIANALELPPTPPSQMMKDVLSGTSSATPLPSPKLPRGVTAYFGGMAEMMADSFSSLFQALVLAIILTYMLLAAIMESYRFPLIIMMTLPLALVGVSMALVITGKSISMFSLMSMVMLVGIVVNNGILLIDYTEHLRREEKKSLFDAVLTACPIRLRPIIMSSLATALGMLPLAMGLGEGGEFRAPMAIVAIGGLLVSTSLAVFVVPVMYVMMETRREKKEAKLLAKGKA